MSSFTRLESTILSHFMPEALQRAQLEANTQQAYLNVDIANFIEKTETQALKTLSLFAEQVGSLDHGKSHTLGLPNLNVTNAMRLFFDRVLLAARYSVMSCDQSEIKLECKSLNEYTVLQSEKIAKLANEIFIGMGSLIAEGNSSSPDFKKYTKYILEEGLPINGNVLVKESSEEGADRDLFIVEKLSKFIHKYPLNSAQVVEYFAFFLSDLSDVEKQEIKNAIDLKISLLGCLPNIGTRDLDSQTIEKLAEEIAIDLHCSLIQVVQNIEDYFIKIVKETPRNQKNIDSLTLVSSIEKIVQANYPAVLKMCRELALTNFSTQKSIINSNQADKLRSLWNEFYHFLIFQIQSQYVKEKVFSEGKLPDDLPSFRKTNQYFWNYVGNTEDEKTSHFFQIIKILSSTKIKITNK